MQGEGTQYYVAMETCRGEAHNIMLLWRHAGGRHTILYCYGDMQGGGTQYYIAMETCRGEAHNIILLWRHAGGKHNRMPLDPFPIKS